MSAVTAAAVAAVATAGVAAYSAVQQKKAADKSQAFASKNAKALYGSKTKAPEYVDTTDMKPFDFKAGIKDYRDALPFLNQIATSQTKAGQKNREIIGGGMFQANMNQQGANIAAMLKGKVPQDVIDSITRATAEKVGGGMVPGGGNDGSTGTNEFARNLGLTSVDLMTKGMSFAPIWEQLVDQFTVKPEDAANQALQMLAARNQQNALLMQRDSMKYAADANTNKAESMPDPQVVGGFKDQQTYDALRMQAKTNQLNAMVGLINSGSSMYGSFNTGGAKYTGSAESYGLEGLGGKSAGATPVYRPTAYS